LLSPRGARSSALNAYLVGDTSDLSPIHASSRTVTTSTDVLLDEDLQLALYCCYQLQVTTFAGVDSHHEWDSSVIAFRRALELEIEDSLRLPLVVQSE